MHAAKPDQLPKASIYFDQMGVLYDSEDDRLALRVLFVYDDVNQSDVVHLFDELDSFQDHMEQMFPPMGAPFPFGNEKQKKSYVNGNLRLFVWNQSKDTVARTYFEISCNSTLQQLLKRKDYQIPPNFTPIVHVIPKDSPILSQFV